MPVKTFLLRGGIECIADVEVIHGLSPDSVMGWRVVRPFRVIHAPVPMQTPRGPAITVMTQMVPLLQTTAQSSIMLSPEDVVGPMMEPTKQAEQGYLQQTTGIQLAQ